MVIFFGQPVKFKITDNDLRHDETNHCSAVGTQIKYIHVFNQVACTYAYSSVSNTIFAKASSRKFLFVCD